MKLLLASLMLVASLAHAGTSQTILDVTIIGVDRSDFVDAKFYMNETTGEGFANVSVTEMVVRPWNDNRFPGGWTHCTPYGGCIPTPGPRPLPEYRTVYEKTVAIPGLSLHGDRVVFAGANGDVECGHMGYTRVLRNRAIFLNGNCSLTTSVRNSQLTVNFNTK